MVDRDKIENLIRHLGRYTEYLRAIARIEREEFLSDPLAIGSARYYLLASVESCIDIANHIIATERLRSPTDYKDTFHHPGLPVRMEPRQRSEGARGCMERHR